MATTSSPLRYPGGKSALADFLQRVIEATGLRDPFYAEPYCGGGGAGISLLRREAVSDIFLNDIDPAIHAFWLSVRDQSQELCRRIKTVSLNLHEWEVQREVLQNPEAHGSLDLGFACLFLNRVNRSGVLTAGPIGGRSQEGSWRLDARFNREGLVEKVERIARYRSRLHVSCLDAEDFLSKMAALDNRPALTYLDPPYYQKGRKLYANQYSPVDHRRLATLLLTGVVRYWIVSYNAVPAVLHLYEGLPRLTYSLAYCASRRYAGREVMFFAPAIKLPAEVDPFATSRYRAWRGHLTLPPGRIGGIAG